ncbi:MAG TPA: hypothetical protein VL049_05570 [Candidatus Dormibacteraeota bacterium]|nr:hypothetical protein [Candidatus Dormibacteraeota bacterium]
MRTKPPGTIGGAAVAAIDSRCSAVSAGLRDQSFHDLRHGAASLLLAQGVQPRAIMDLPRPRPGGRDARPVTSHVLPEVRRDAADKMDAMSRAGSEHATRAPSRRCAAVTLSSCQSTATKDQLLPMNRLRTSARCAT